MTELYECTGEKSNHFAAYGESLPEVLRSAAGFIQGYEAGNKRANFHITTPYFIEGDYHIIVFVTEPR